MNGTEEDLAKDWLQPVVKEYGRQLVELVMNVAMAQQAAETLGSRVAGWPQGAYALKVLTAAFNAASTALCEKEGWGEEKLSRCQQAIQLAWAGKIVPAEERKIILMH